MSISKLRAEARKLKRAVIITGDFNAAVGIQCAGDSVQTVGVHGIGTRNDRGKWLVQWATAEDVTFCNTQFREPFEKQWIYIKCETKKQTD